MLSDYSGIEWTGATWNPWQGCRKVSAGCANCYMFREKNNYGQDPRDIHRSKESTFNRPLVWQKECREGDRTGTDRLVFTCSWSDFFIKKSDPWRSQAWEIIRACPSLRFQILTKRPERIPGRLPNFWDEIRDRVWLGVSIADEKKLKRALLISKFNARVRFLSLEPLLGPIDLENVDVGGDVVNILEGKSSTFYDEEGKLRDLNRPGPIDWVIIGGESGPDARPMNPSWVMDLIEQCRRNDVPVFFKQWGAYTSVNQAMTRGIGEHSVDIYQFENGNRVIRVGTKKAGRTIMGKQYNQFPEDEELFTEVADQ